MDAPDKSVVEIIAKETKQYLCEPGTDCRCWLLLTSIMSQFDLTFPSVYKQDS